MIFFIYQYTNKINNKKYVGQTNNFQRRNTSDETVRRVNVGAVDKDESLIYPLR